MVPLLVTPKSVAPIEQQDPFETRKVWDDVSQALLRKNFSTAGKNKQALEQRQRDKAEARKKSGKVYTPRFFQPEAEGEAWDGRPILTQEGLEAIEKEFKADYPKPEVKDVSSTAL
ncbi:BQ2448_5895 [Microbotryum intermedium]|uniref:BQ2448_5895 protein n=1 Tax=Microbotryum intermedium TaxID=269621 RepID=A0A238F3E2_9BASI|nr:BQ2448_5895 [Microbotryum intermedium]